jgi:hypothetical protein
VTATALSEPFETKPSTLALSFSLYIYATMALLLKCLVILSAATTAFVPFHTLPPPTQPLRTFQLLFLDNHQNERQADPPHEVEGTKKRVKRRVWTILFLPVMQEASMMKP